MKAEDIERALAEREANGMLQRQAVTGVAPLANPIRMALVAAGTPPLTEPPPESAPTLGPDLNLPSAYRGHPQALLARCHPLLRAEVERRRSAAYGGLFLGPSGCGKSSAAAWAIRCWRAARHRDGKPYSTGWVDALELTDAERRYKLGTGTPAILDTAYTADWLVLDDVGTTASTTLIQLILSSRYRDCKPTLVTSGLEVSQLVAHIGSATVRRIIEHEGQGGPFVDCHQGGGL